MERLLDVFATPRMAGGQKVPKRREKLCSAQTVGLEHATSHLRRALGLDVPIRTILESEYGAVFEPEDIAHLTAAFEAALTRLGLVDRKDPLTTTVAKSIIRLARAGERDPQKLCDEALRILGK
jgi:hypothetical protein